ncbi:hypothetical protein [Novosphingobium sp. FKTRR1]|uniref:hypothetical protein n=1 Tax=Novosphingobium sp. FKTRR1 TaxID=2879118 RepID=UPI001CF0BE2C|nr:hypothetical protein [Novosphingobium sp. FKTRR1]
MSDPFFDAYQAHMKTLGTGRYWYAHLAKVYSGRPIQAGCSVECDSMGDAYRAGFEEINAHPEWYSGFFISRDLCPKEGIYLPYLDTSKKRQSLPYRIAPLSAWPEPTP